MAPIVFIYCYLAPKLTATRFEMLLLSSYVRYDSPVAQALGRKTVKLNRSGGSRSVTVPKAWLRSVGVTDDVDRAELVLTKSAITIGPSEITPQSIEDDPLFADFLNFVLRGALRHPKTLTDAAAVLAADQDLVPKTRGKSRG